MSAPLQSGYTLQRPTMDDAPRVHKLLAIVDTAEFGDADDASLEDLLDLWRRINLEQDIWLVIAPDGELAGYGYVQQRQIIRNDVEVYVHPAHEGCGIGTTLVRWSEAWARDAVPLAPSGEQVYINNWINAANSAARELLEQEGYHPARFFWRMGISLESERAPWLWPEGITVRTAAEIGDLHQFYEIVEEGMADHWGHVAVPYDEWVERNRGSGFDARLWFLAFAGETPAGAALCQATEGAGWVETLVVRRAYRQRGLGSALLANAFDKLQQGGNTMGRLVVDADSLTGATRLYERAGMQVEQQYAAYRKWLSEQDPTA